MRSGEQVALGRAVAVKTLKPEKRNPDAALDLLREAWVTGALEHPNIVPVHALELAADGTPSIVMKKIGGVEWSALMHDHAQVHDRYGGNDQLAWNLEILMRVLDALRFAHSHGIVHRDLKPANVMIGDFGEVYLLDWGIAVSLRDDGSGRFPLAIHATALAGTPSYMAPEMLGRESGPKLSELTDVYLAGAVLHEIISGNPPHRGTNIYAVIVSVIASRPELPSSAPPELARICARAMHADPAHRFASVEELQRALRDYLGHRGSEQVATRARGRLGELTTMLETTPHEQDVYRLFGACRSGFHDALSVWPDNDVAKRGLVEAVTAVAKFELDRGKPQAAVTLLGELHEPHPLLEQARVAASKQTERVAELEKLGRDHDSSIGTRTRAMLMATFGFAFSVLPVVIWLVPAFRYASYPLHVAWAFSALALLAARPTVETYTWNLLIYTVVAGMLALTIERYLWPATPVYLAAFLLANRYPDHALLLASVPNLVFTLLATWRWKPATIRYTAEERAERSRRRQARSSS